MYYCALQAFVLVSFLCSNFYKLSILIDDSKLESKNAYIYFAALVNTV